MDGSEGQLGLWLLPRCRQTGWLERRGAAVTEARRQKDGQAQPYPDLGELGAAGSHLRKTVNSMRAGPWGFAPSPPSGLTGSR